MQRLPPYTRLLLLTEGRLGVFSSKTAASVLRYRANDVIGVLDSHCAGQAIAAHIPWAPDVPIFPSIEQALGARPQALVIGIAPVGGGLTDAMRRHVRDALHRGIDVLSGLHVRLAADPELAELAASSGARLLDLRHWNHGRTVAAGRARETHCRRILTVGTDAAVGKMVTALELTRAASRAGVDARFVATGQTGILISGAGVAVDAVVSDFAAGAIETQVLAQRDAAVVFVEGQGSLSHPGFSGVTLSLLHGSCPDALVLVHHVGRTHFGAVPDTPLPPLEQLVEAYERVGSLVYPTRIAAVALNAFGADAARTEAERARIAAALGCPVGDPTTADGVALLLEPLLGGWQDSTPAR